MGCSRGAGDEEAKTLSRVILGLIIKLWWFKYVIKG